MTNIIKKEFPFHLEYSYPDIDNDNQSLIENILKIDKKVKTLNNRHNVSYLSILNDSQYYAATRDTGVYSVIAAPGSGKTSTIVARASNLIKGLGKNPKSILILTFTKKAARELKLRISDNIGHIADGCEASTFHSFALNFIFKNRDKFGVNKNFNILSQPDSIDAIDMIISSKGYIEDKSFPRARYISQFIGYMNSFNLNFDQACKCKEYNNFKFNKERIEDTLHSYGVYKKNNHLFDFDDLLFLFVKGLKSDSDLFDKIKSRYQYVIIDEFQDSNWIQNEMTSLLGTNGNLMVVFDDSQSIYRFRGADINNAFNFCNKFKNSETIYLDVNYRSSEEIVNFTNSISNSIQLGFNKSATSNTGKVGQNPQVIRFQSVEQEAQFISDNISNLIYSGVSPNEICVLNRSSFSNRTLQAYLRMNRIDFKVVGGGKFMESKHVRDYLAMLKLCNNAKDTISWYRILNKLEGVGKVKAKRIIEKIINNGGQIPINSFKPNSKEIEGLTLLSITIDSINSSNNIQIKLTKGYEYIIQFYQDDDNLTGKMEDIKMLISMGKNYKNLTQYLSDFIVDRDDKENVDEKVTLSTIHSAKGLEWDYVFIIHCIDGIFPSHRSETFSELEEERRVFYVACSRPRKELYLTYPSYVNNQGKEFTKPCRFISELSEDVFEYLEESNPYTIF